MNSKVKIAIGLLILILVVGGVWYFAYSNQQVISIEATKIREANLPSLHGLPFYLAIDKGYFKDAGLDIEMTKFEAPNQIIDAVISGQVDFTSTSGASGIAAVADFKNSGKIKIYALSGGDNVVPNDSIVVQKDSTIKSIQELRGKKVGILPGIQWRTIVKSVFTQHNLDSDKDIIIVELAPALQAQALASGQIDVLVAIEPMLTTVKGKDIGKEIVKGMTNQFIANPFYGGAGIVNVDFAKKNPTTTARVIEIVDRVVKEIKENPQIANQYLKGYTPLEDNLISQAPVLRFQMANNLTSDEMTAGQKFLDIFSTYKVVDGQLDFEKLLY